jgi:hypothetical protein
MLEVELRGSVLSCCRERKEEKTMVSPQTRYTPPREEQYPTPHEESERFVRLRLALSVALVIVSMAMLVAVVGVLFTYPVYATLGLTGALIGIGIAAVVLLCINIVTDYLIFTHGKR